MSVILLLIQMLLPGWLFFLVFLAVFKDDSARIAIEIAPFFAVKLGGYQQLVPFLLRGGHHLIVIRAASAT